MARKGLLKYVRQAELQEICTNALNLLQTLAPRAFSWTLRLRGNVCRTWRGENLLLEDAGRLLPPLSRR